MSLARFNRIEDLDGNPLWDSTQGILGTVKNEEGDSQTILQALNSRFPVYNVESYGAIGDGLTDDQVAIDAAVQAAFTNSGYVYWPNNDFLSSASISNFHDVRHSGPGRVVRDGDTFIVSPSKGEKSTLYVSPSGGGDGLSRSSGISVADAFSALKGAGLRAYSGEWELLYTAGTYTDDGVQPEFLPAFSEGITLKGELDPVTGDHLSIWDGSTSSAAYAFRLDLVSLAQIIRVEDLHFTNWEANPSNSGAIVAWGGHILRTTNVKVTNARIGIWVSRNSYHRSIGDHMENCSVWGFGCQYSSSVVVGLDGQRTQFINCGIGLHVGRVSVGHNDYSDFIGNEQDIYATQNSRITHIDPTYSNWSVASHFIQNGCVNESLEVGSFDEASITDATPVLRTENGAIVDAIQGVGTEHLHTSFAPASGYQLTGTTAETLLTDKAGFGAITRFPKYCLYQGEEFCIRFQARVQASLSVSGATFTIRGASSSAAQNILEFSLPSSGFSGFVEAHIEFKADGTAFAYGELKYPGGSVISTNTVGASTRDLLRDKTDTQTLWRLYAQIADPGDSFTLLTAKTWVTI